MLSHAREALEKRLMIAQQAKGLVLLIAASAFAVQQARAVDIEPPKVKLVDKFGVNMANGQVTHSIDIVSIGGAMGLSDSVSVYANEFNFLGYRGFNHKYFAQARNVQLSTSPTFSPLNVMRVHDPSGSADFAYYVGGALQQSGTATSGYTYVALADERHTLAVNGNYLDWTKPDGTVVKFDRGAPSRPANVGGLLSSITYPNGFTVTVTSAGMSVNTNTGFQLKRTYLSGAEATTVGSQWALHNPQHVYGVNAAVEYCNWTATTCSFANTWPKATFVWPAGMPQTMFSGSKNISVTNAQGITTTYRFAAYDLAYHPDGSIAAGHTPGQRFSPRLASISAPNNTNGTVFSYEYKNLFTPYPGDYYDIRLQDAGVVTKAIGQQGIQILYDMLRSYYSDTQNLGLGGANGIPLVHLASNVNGAVGAIYYADTDDGRIYFETTPRNFPTSFDKNAAPDESYTYTRSNLTGISYGNGAYSIAAEYPASCTSSTRKTCNQATRMRDANGNWTDYAYHAQSGQVSRITHPANKHGIRPETRYEYTQLSANYYNSAGTKTAGTPIWMKTAEKYCINSSAANNVCSGGDEVVTRYEYNHDNLLMTGMTVTDPTPGGQTLRTCFQYDIYGNQIGKTLPKANLSSCP
jgi:hypothetical protein